MKNVKHELYGSMCAVRRFNLTQMQPIDIVYKTVCINIYTVCPTKHYIYNVVGVGVVINTRKTFSFISFDLKTFKQAFFKLQVYK